MRNWRISTRLVSLLALPVIAATTLGGMRISNSLQNVDQLSNMELLTEMTEKATTLAAALQEERDRSAGPLISTGNEKDDVVVAPREDTDEAIQSFREATGDIDGSDKVMAGVQSTVLDIARQLTSINTIRERAYENPAYVSQTVNAYNQLIESLLSLSQDMAQATSNSEMIQSTRALAAFSSAKEYASIQRAIISAGLAHEPTAQLSETDRLFAKTATESERAELKSFQQIYGDEKTASLTKPIDGGDVNVTLADKYRDRMLHSTDAIKKEKRTYVDWMDQDASKIDNMNKIEKTLLAKMEQQARELKSEAQQEALLNGAIILLVLGISLVGAFVVARSMVRSLRRLQDTAQDVARERLPELVKQMSEADPQDVDTSVESVGVHSRDEIGKVAAAFDDVHREAVRLAGEQALLRGNVNAMFTNLSRRSQGLIQRQLSLISELESREADPDQLSSLFKLDHLATRMRRNGENLLVLAGEEPGRRWTRPVPLVDVLRAAASEVEQYERIELSSVPATEVTGRVVNDLVHLLAELLENATSFSSPQTKVKVTGHALPDGRVLIEIHDTGIGLSPEDLSAINERLANPPTVDVSVSRRMGLFVVGRLSLRHGIRIQLRPSDSGGTTALVMLPVDIAQGGAAPKGRPGAPNGQGGAPAAGRGGKGGNLAAALQRGPQGSPGGPRTGAGAGAEGGNRLGAAPPRGQVSGGSQRPALPGSGGPGASGGTDFFGGSAPANRPADGSSLPPLPTRGASNSELPGGPNAAGSGSQGGPGPFARPPQPDGPGSAGPFPQQQGPQSGGPGGTGGFARPGAPEGPGSTGQFPQLSSAEGPGSTAELPRVPAEGEDGPGSTGQFPRVPAQGGPSTTGQFAQPPQPDGPGGTGQFAQPDGPGQTGQFAQPGPGPEQTGQFAQLAQPDGPGQTGQFARPDGPGGTGQFAQPDGPGQTGQFAQPGAGPEQTGQFAQPQGPGSGGPGETGEFARPGADEASTTGAFAAPQVSGGAPSGPAGASGGQDRPVYSDLGLPGASAGRPTGPDAADDARPSWARGGQGPGEDEPRGHDEPEGTGEHVRPDWNGAGGSPDPSAAQPGQSAPSGQSAQPAQQSPRPAPSAGGQEPADGIPAVPPAPADAPTPIFASMESNWFSGAPEQQPQAPQSPAESTQQIPDVGTASQPLGPGAGSVPPMPQRRPAREVSENGQGAGAPTGAAASPDSWSASPNDERWRQAEQVRQPSAGGVTTSGLPRRVPRANLVAGTAQQQSSQPSGPQVSRAPDDVRGRLTNLRRGIQQGRQAGTDGRGIGPTYQQER
nr:MULTISPECIES: nitrate- and nitrite sensing domain-containing protein [Streptomyces]